MTLAKTRYYPSIKQATPEQVETAMRRAYDAVYDVRDELEALKAAIAGAATKEQLAAGLASSVQSINALPALDLMTAGRSTPLIRQSSVPPTINGSFAYTSTTTSITWYWDGTNGSTVLTILWPDGTQTPIPAGNLAITGLSANTTYRFYPYYDQLIYLSVQFVSVTGAVGTPAVAYTASSFPAQAVQLADGHVPLSAGAMNGITPAAGTGGGSGGGCPIEGTRLESFYGPLIVNPVKWSDWVEITAEHGLKLRASPQHPVFTERAGKTAIADLRKGDAVVTRMGISQVRKIEGVSQAARKLIVDCPQGHLYYAGGFLSHNLKPS